MHAVSIQILQQNAMLKRPTTIYVNYNKYYLKVKFELEVD